MQKITEYNSYAVEIISLNSILIIALFNSTILINDLRIYKVIQISHIPKNNI